MRDGLDATAAIAAVDQIDRALARHARSEGRRHRQAADWLQRARHVELVNPPVLPHQQQINGGWR